MRPAAFSRNEWLSLLFATAFAQICFYRRVLHSGFCCDGQIYTALGELTQKFGLWHEASYNPLRTYGYPLFLSGTRAFSEILHVPSDLTFFVAQLGLYLLVAWLLRREVTRISPAFARVVFVGLIANPFVLIYTAESLTESFTLTTVVFLGFCWLWSLRTFRSWSYFWPVAIGSLIAGFSVMVRPANLFLLFAWLFGQTWILSFRKLRGDLLKRTTAVTVMLLAACVPFWPQLWRNATFGKKATPLVVDDLVGFQHWSGIKYLKYATGVPPAPALQIYYLNPFVKPGEVNRERPLEWYRAHPARGVVTLAAHSFNLLDQDLPFPYSADVSPWYRLPVGIVNHAGIGLAAVGLFFVLIMKRNPVLRISRPVLFVYITGVFGIYLTTAVESRFGLPLILIAPILGYLGFRHLWTLPKRKLPVIGIVAYTVMALLTSGWMRNQSPVIAAWEERQVTQSSSNLR